MTLNRALPPQGAKPPLDIFECRTCQEFTTQAAKDERSSIDWDNLMMWR